MAKLDQRIQLVASNEFSQTIDDWRRGQSDLPSRSEAIRRLVELGLRYDGEHPMHMVTAIIRPHKYEDVREALLKLGVQGMTVSQVSGFGRQRGQTEIYRGAEYQTHEVPKVRVDIAVESSILHSVIEAIKDAASTGKTGDGKIFVQPLSEAIRIRTGERDDVAIG
jgi:nitrogen regulatory protein P-II 2